eukprot:scaffold1849_cov115-Cylindrotheca_fusiformis.AAC.5
MEAPAKTSKILEYLNSTIRIVRAVKAQVIMKTAKCPSCKRLHTALIIRTVDLNTVLHHSGEDL